MKSLIFSLITMVAISSLAFATAQGPQSQIVLTCMVYQDGNLAVVKAVEQFTTAPLYCDGHEKTISVLLGLGFHIAGVNQFEVFMTK